MKKMMFNEVWEPIHLNGCDLDISNFGNIRFSKDNGILQTSIANCIHGHSKSAGGFIWKLK